MGVGNSRGGTGKCPHSIEAPWRIYYNRFMPYREQRISFVNRLYYSAVKIIMIDSSEKGLVNLNASSRGNIQDPSVIPHDWA